jgi:hypothetical protein
VFAGLVLQVPCSLCSCKGTILQHEPLSKLFGMLQVVGLARCRWLLMQK